MGIDQVQEEKLKLDLIFQPLNSKEELRDWMTVFLGITFPMGVVHPESTHAPVDAMWEIYRLIKTGESAECPEVVMLASRDSYKTLSAAALEVLCLVHFQFSIAHAAAVLSQSEKAIQYNNIFFRKIRPYLEAHGWRKISDSKSKIEWLLPDQRTIYLRVLVMTPKGMNTEHLPMLFLDEIDLVQDPRALEEAKMVPSIWRQYFPLTISLSTRKYKGGLMEKKIKEVTRAGGKILRWNILDVTTKIPENLFNRNKKITRYISSNLPYSNLSNEEWSQLNDEEKLKYEKFEAYEGIHNHPLLSVMRHYLTDRSKEDIGNLYKPLIAVLNNFKLVTPDMADAQLLCNNPSSIGLVYSRFSEKYNVLDFKDAIEKLTDEDCPQYIDYFQALIQLLKEYGANFIGGGDWGFSDYTSLVVLAILPNEDVYLLDIFLEQYLELDHIIKYMKELDNIYGIEEWYTDQNYPAYLKTMKKKGLNVKKFAKSKGSVEDGITSVQGKIVNASNHRKFFIIKNPNNQVVIDAFSEYRWKLDGKGEIIEGVPYHDKDGVADIMDSIRYPFKNLFGKGGIRPSCAVANGENEKIKPKINSNSSLKDMANEINKSIIQNHIGSLATKKPLNQETEKKKNKKRLFWSF